MTEAPVSPLRRRMIEDMTMRKFAPRTERGRPHRTPIGGTPVTLSLPPLQFSRRDLGHPVSLTMQDARDSA